MRKHIDRLVKQLVVPVDVPAWSVRGGMECECGFDFGGAAVLAAAVG